MAYDLEELVRLQAVKDLGDRVKAEIDNLKNTGVASALKKVDVDGNAIKFYTSSDTAAEAAFTIDLPAEIFLDALSTKFEPNFNFANGNYTGATDPNLEGRAVFVLGVKTKTNDGKTTTLAYSFLDMTGLVDIYTASDTSVVITDYKVKANVSADSDNMLATTANGLKVDGSGKVDKVTTATAGNLAAFVAGGGISDTGISIATNAEVTEMLDGIFGAQS